MHWSMLGFSVQALQKWMQKAANGEVEGLWWWFMARWLSEAQRKSSKATLLFSIATSQYSSVSVRLYPCPHLMRNKIPASMKQQKGRQLLFLQ